MRPPLQAAIFDMDGLLIDSEPIHFESLRSQLAKLGVDYQYALHETLVGTTDEHCYKVIRAANPQLKVPTPQLVAERHAIFLELVDKPLTPLPGVRQTLDAFRSAGLPLAVASSSPSAHIHRVIENLGLSEYFEAMWSGCDVPRSKPHPDVYLAAAGTLAIDPAGAVVFEDSGPGVAAGAAAGAVVIAVPQRETLSHDLSPASLQLSSLEDFSLEDLVRGWAEFT